jgi:hypothetical protein
MWKLGCVALIVVFATNSWADTPDLAVPPSPAAPSAERPSLSPALSTHGWTIDLTGYVQVDSVLYAEGSVDELDPSTNAPLNQEHFGIPRASLRADARRGAFAGELELEAFTTRATLPRVTQTSGVRLETAEVRWRHRELVEVVGGLFRTPFGAQTPTSPRDRLFLELPTMSRALFPGDIDAGIMARGAFGLARWSIAAMNGAPVGDAAWKAADPASSYDVVGRVGADVPGPYQSRYVVGVSALAGTSLSPGTPPTKDQLTWVDENQDGLVQSTELHVVPGTPGIPSRTYHHSALGADVAVHWSVCAIGKGVAFAEAVIATNLDRGLVYADPVKTTRDLRELGFTIGAVQDVSDHAQVGVRYDRYDADRDAMEMQGVSIVGTRQVFSTLSVMAAGRYEGAKLMIEYDHAGNPFGRAADGNRITRADDRVTLRAQVGF